MAYFERPVEVLPEVVTAVNAALRHQVDSAEALSSLGLAYAYAIALESDSLVNSTTDCSAQNHGDENSL